MHGLCCQDGQSSPGNMLREEEHVLLLVDLASEAVKKLCWLDHATGFRPWYLCQMLFRIVILQLSSEDGSTNHGKAAAPWRQL